MVCACEACSILFEHREVARYKRIGRNIRWVPEFDMTDARMSRSDQTGLAFFANRSPDGHASVFYQSCGMTESRGRVVVSCGAQPGAGRDGAGYGALLVNRMGERERTLRRSSGSLL
jgi:hypothetical protein